jgi:hypothetical protein
MCSEPLPVPMHLGFNNSHFVPHINLWKPCSSPKVPDGPQTYPLNVIRLQKEGTQIRVSEWGQSFTLTKNVGQGFFLCSTLPTQWTVQQSLYMKMSPHGVMSSKKARNSPEFEFC